MVYPLYARRSRLGRSLYHGADLLLPVDVVFRGSGSEREDWGRKVTEYALAGIPSIGSSTSTPNRKSRSCASPTTRDVTGRR